MQAVQGSRKRSLNKKSSVNQRIFSINCMSLPKVLSLYALRIFRLRWFSRWFSLFCSWLLIWPLWRNAILLSSLRIRWSLRCRLCAWCRLISPFLTLLWIRRSWLCNRWFTSALRGWFLAKLPSWAIEIFANPRNVTNNAENKIFDFIVSILSAFALYNRPELKSGV